MRLPDELCKEVASLLESRHGGLLGEGEVFRVTGEIEPQQAEVKVFLHAEGRDELIEVTASATPVDGDEDTEGLLSFALDGLDAFIGEWLEGGREARHSVDLVPHQYRKRPILLGLRRRRPSLEAEADRILRSDEDNRAPEDSS